MPTRCGEQPIRRDNILSHEFFPNQDITRGSQALQGARGRVRREPTLTAGWGGLSDTDFCKSNGKNLGVFWILDMFIL